MLVFQLQAHANYTNYKYIISPPTLYKVQLCKENREQKMKKKFHKQHYNSGFSKVNFLEQQTIANCTIYA